MLGPDGTIEPMEPTEFGVRIVVAGNTKKMILMFRDKLKSVVSISLRIENVQEMIITLHKTLAVADADPDMIEMQAAYTRADDGRIELAKAIATGLYPFQPN